MKDELISKQAAIDELDKGAWGVEWDKALAKAMLENLPSAEPEIIRCKDCKHHHYETPTIPYCDNIDYGYGWKDDDYCSKAERRRDG